jgi:transposase-like protein
MKHTIPFILLLTLIGTAVFAQTGGQSSQGAAAPQFEGELAVWDEMFSAEPSVIDQLSYVKNVSDANLPGAVPFYAKALTRLDNEFPDLKTRAEWEAADEMARLLCPKLGEEEYQDASASLWQTVVYFPNPLVKADALAALGQADADKIYLLQVVQLLKDHNTTIEPDRDMRERSERVVYGAILALESYKDVRGYLPVFDASVGWYNQRIKNQASISLNNIVDDPTDQLITILNTPAYRYDDKFTALMTSERSKSSEDNKAKVAVAALTDGWRNQVADIHERQVLARTRKQALSMIRRYKTDDSAVYTQIDRSYKDGDMDEKLASLQALNALASEDAARLLSGYAQIIHQRRMANTLTTNDEQLIRVIIPALGNIGAVGKSYSRPVLLLIQNSPRWTNTVINLAKTALKNIGV